MLLQCFLEVITSCFCVPYIQQSTPVVGSSATFIDNIFVNSVNLTLFQVTYYFSLLASIVVLILKFLRVFYGPNINKYSNAITHFSITMNLKTKLIK